MSVRGGVGWCVALSCVACADDATDPMVLSDSAGVVGPSYAADIKPLIDASCANVCHSPTASEYSQVPFLTTFGEVAPLALRIDARGVGLNGAPPTMPPMPAVGPVWSDAEAALVREWAETGAAE